LYIFISNLLNSISTVGRCMYSFVLLMMKHVEQFLDVNRSRKHCILLVALLRYTCDARTYERKKINDRCNIPNEVSVYMVENRSVQSIGHTAMRPHHYANCQTYAG